ncbi:MAG: KH domain-containing protein [Calditrichaeota bacterium]|nr:MAG: KH domain-containing protein [Calditrichota bacterium]
MKEFLEFIIKQLVDHPEEVRVEEIKGEHLTIYELHVAKDDIGKVIGKKGKTVSAIRTLLNAGSAAKKENRSILEILD